MLFRFTRVAVALGAVLAVLAIAGVRRWNSPAPLRPLGTRSGPVRITEFHASAGTIIVGQKATLCYGVENAKTVWISPGLQGVYPSREHCLDIVPERTTHYTILAEGFDGGVATRSFTLEVQAPIGPPRPVNYAGVELSIYRNAPMRSTTSPAAVSGI
jgi:hypothetical protein